MTNRDQHDECLSAFLDGELRASDVDRLLEVLNDELTREQLQVWSSVRCAMTHPEPLMRPVDISRRVSEAIATDAGRGGVVVPIRRRRWARSAAGFAIAASVVSAVVVGVLDPRQPGSPEVAVAPLSSPATLATQTVASAVPDGANAGAKELVIALPQTVSDRRDPTGQLNPYLINHVRYGGGYALGGSLGYARVAAATDEPAEQR